MTDWQALARETWYSVGMYHGQEPSREEIEPLLEAFAEVERQVRAEKPVCLEGVLSIGDACARCDLNRLVAALTASEQKWQDMARGLLNLKVALAASEAAQPNEHDWPASVEVVAERDNLKATQQRWIDALNEHKDELRQLRDDRDNLKVALAASEAARQAAEQERETLMQHYAEEHQAHLDAHVFGDQMRVERDTLRQERDELQEQKDLLLGDVALGQAFLARQATEKECAALRQERDALIHHLELDQQAYQDLVKRSDRWRVDLGNRCDDLDDLHARLTLTIPEQDMVQFVRRNYMQFGEATTGLLAILARLTASTETEPGR